jgi:beta-glucanase (GH16 family)
MIYPVFSIVWLVFMHLLSVGTSLDTRLRALRQTLAAQRLAAADESPASFCSAPGWHKEWEDEFTEDRLGDSWAPVVTAAAEGDTSAPVSGLGVTACRSARCRQENVRVEDGKLKLLTERDAEDPSKYYTGAVSTRGLKNWKDDKPYRMCVSAKLPGGGGHGRGVWPAHWMLPDNGLSEKCLDEGEVDIMEMINGDGGAYSTYHYMSSWPNMTCGDFNKYHKSRNTLTHVPHWSEKFNEYAIERSKDHISYAVNGQVVHSIPSAKLKIPLSHSPFFLILNTALGGAWPGEPTPETKLPTEHHIDYVRVARRSDDAPAISLLSLPEGRSADDMSTEELAKSASWADAWRPSSFLEEGATFGPPPPLSMV